MLLDLHSDRSAIHLADFWSISCNRRAWREERKPAVLVYILLGAIGVPVFAGFTGGIGILLRNTGGYIVGFLFSALVMWAMEMMLGKKMWVLALSMVAGLVVCYAFGTVWFMAIYAKEAGAIGLTTALGWCVFPFLVPDLIKIALALVLSKRLTTVIKMQ